MGALGRSIPTSNRHVTTKAGDIMLYNGNQIVMFYGNNSWNYALIGHINHESLDQLKAFLHAGEGRINITLSLSNNPNK